MAEPNPPTPVVATTPTPTPNPSPAPTSTSVSPTTEVAKDGPASFLDEALTKAKPDADGAKPAEGAAKTDARHAELGFDAVFWGTDYAYNAGPFLSPAMFREFILPYAKARTESVHSLGLPVIQHACGNNWALLDFFVEIGFECYQSIQNSAGMDLKLLKKRYGRKIALWGGVGVEKLVAGTPEDVAADVRYALRYGKPGGGYIFGASHSIAVGTKYDNYMRMLEEFRRLREY